MRPQQFHRLFQRPGILLALILMSIGSMSGQSAAPVAAAPAPRDDSGGTIRVNVRLVNVFATVTDAHGAPVGGLQKEDFKVLEDGVEQSIRVFDKESEMPLSIIMGIDTSESTRRDLKLETASAKRFAQSIVRTQDRLAILQITEELRTQYMIAYYPNKRISAAPFRRIQVQVAKADPEGAALKVRHRAGYYTAPAK